jgi:hypothetical protein
MVVRRIADLVTADFTSAVLASGNIDQSNAMTPVTNGAAALVPLEMIGCPLAPRLVMPSPGAMSPRRAIELPTFDAAIGRPLPSQATTGITPGWRVIAELPTVP